jgi:adenylylsulfate kinase
MTTHTQDIQNKGLVLWLTGLSSSGKTTLSMELEREMKLRGCRVEVLDGDLVRKSLSKGLGFSREDRETNIRRIGFVSHLLSRNGVIVIVAAISPYRASRGEVRRMMQEPFVEIYLNAPLEACEARDPKGLYAMARAGELRAFTGINDPYEEPLNPEIVCYTAEEKISQSLGKIMAHLEEMEYIPLKPQLEYFI